MNRSELIAALADRAEVTRKDADAVLAALAETVGEVVAKGDEKVTIPGFLTFERTHRAARTARNPQTGEAAWAYQMTPFDEWDYDGVNEMILTEQEIGGRSRKVLTHFDRNGFGYTLDRATGALLAAEKFDPSVNWASRVAMDPAAPDYGRPVVDKRYAPGEADEDETTKNICPGALGAKNQQPAAYSPLTRLFYVPTNHMCMDYEAFRVTYTPGQPYVGATLTLHPPEGTDRTGAFIAWDGAKGRIAWSIPSGDVPTISVTR